MALFFVNVILDMSSSSSSVVSDSSSSDDDTPPPLEPDLSQVSCGPPRQLCFCTKCVGVVSQKSYVCVEHIERFGRYQGLTPGASSSHMVCANTYDHCIYLHSIPSHCIFLFECHFHFNGILWFSTCNRVLVRHDDLSHGGFYTP